MMRFLRVMFSITRTDTNNVGKGLKYERISEYRNNRNGFLAKENKRTLLQKKQIRTDKNLGFLCKNIYVIKYR